MKPKLFGSIAVALLLSASHASAQESQHGREVFLRNCAVCHTSLSPRIGDEKAWAPFVALDENALVAAVVNGGGSMAPRAGRPDLSDSDIRAALRYILSRAKPVDSFDSRKANDRKGRGSK